MDRLLIHNIGQLVTPLGRSARRGQEQGKLQKLQHAWVLLEGECIAQVGEGDPPPAPGAARLDAGGRLATPGLVDAHTHLIFGGWRQNELALKLHGVPYLDILAQGGGILSTVQATRAASQQQLEEKAARALDEMFSFGTTTCEAKSGYGLSTQEECKQLRAIRALDERYPVDLVSTFLGAHALPQEYRDRRGEYLRLLCEEMIPAVAAEGLAEFCDVFCETGVFTAEESREILLCGRRHGLRPKIHADEIDPIGGSQLAGEVGAISAEHLIVCPPQGISSMARAGTVACLLPATSFYLGASFAPARQMIDAGVPVAMATDFNPGSCPCLNLQLVMNLGCLKYRLTPEEVLTAVTLNGAAAIGRAQTVGSLEPGKLGDLVLWEAADLEYLCYRLGSNLVHTVIKRGRPHMYGGPKGPGRENVWQN
ncbi:MAG TPA: imidazolonepropionase [Candidatus Anaerotruncus excrementipullorum]|uniref:Imidazolonepropionase n=1 Tax=Candidatus Anaerotruncus excrementipullorum TaxID=2838465 RepID=A0A9D1WRV4_9FIRM|nr:imidazolonepropionase [Candidatus Anaerotruncus excrementipullorum]